MALTVTTTFVCSESEDMTVTIGPYPLYSSVKKNRAWPLPLWIEVFESVVTVM